MELKQLFATLREHGITEVTFKLAPVAEPKKETIVENTIVANETDKPKRVVKHRRKPRKLTPEQIAKIREKKCPGYFTISEIAVACGLAENIIYKFVNKDTTPSYQDKTSHTKFYKLEDVYDRRSAYEVDVLKNDGHRRGPVKFVADKMLELLK